MNDSADRLSKYHKITENYCENTYKESTYKSYKSCLNIVCSEIEQNYIFEDLKYSDIIEIITDWQEHYKNKTITNRLTVLKKLTKMATNDGYFLKDPCEKLEGLKPDTVLEEKKPFSKGDFRKMENTETQFPSGKALALLGRLLGLRMQEAVALCWSDIHFKERKVSICRSRTLKEFNGPKTKQSRRTIDLTDEAMSLLQNQFNITGNREAIDIKVRDVSKTAFTPHSFRPVFVNDLTGKAFTDSKNYAQRFFTKFLEDTGLKHRGPSQLRHSFASITLSGGAPIKLVSVIMGHVDTSVTEKHYAQWLSISDEDTRSMLSAAQSLHDEPNLEHQADEINSSSAIKHSNDSALPLPNRVASDSQPDAIQSVHTEPTLAGQQSIEPHNLQVEVSRRSTWQCVKFGLRVMGLFPKSKPKQTDFGLLL
ncbi:hypothetical protein A9264_15915 [Vibrio sp. UCD-FRSSP16_10]|uniref:tyrosine-type recombinase/integrase n=1 Tax=unclassified Vibrio TaxID=2614977 RepID=UPI0007FC409D|nr:MULTISPECIES: site-specific integrase [unclassified Vibrio]OBT12741.1 hypothetical protein A9260_15840 [Vibrio sp. UCD-FRSSP16_30]OBT18208.1 hypothetical protein A9264_15915 [Vibrio sp. UCD-FRSSP16_10]